MNKSIVNHERMMSATLTVLNKHDSLYAGDTGLMGCRDRLAVILFQMDEAGKVQQLVTKGLSETRKLREIRLIGETLTLCAALHAYGETTENAHLTSIANLKSSKLKKMRKPELVILVSGLCDQATPIAGDLVDFGADSYFIDALRSLNEEYNAVLHEYRSAVAARIAATKDLRRLVKSGTILLRKQMDNLMKKHETSHPNFFNAYVSGRRIVDLGIRHEADDEPKGGDVVTDSADGK